MFSKVNHETLIFNRAGTNYVRPLDCLIVVQRFYCIVLYECPFRVMYIYEDKTKLRIPFIKIGHKVNLVVTSEFVPNCKS